jgi:hypothetical protein
MSTPAEPCYCRGPRKHWHVDPNDSRAPGYRYEVWVRFRNRRLSRVAFFVVFFVARLLFQSGVATRIDWHDPTYREGRWP